VKNRKSHFSGSHFWLLFVDFWPLFPFGGLTVKGFSSGPLSLKCVNSSRRMVTRTDSPPTVQEARGVRKTVHTEPLADTRNPSHTCRNPITLHTPVYQIQHGTITGDCTDRVRDPNRVRRHRIGHRIRNHTRNRHRILNHIGHRVRDPNRVRRHRVRDRIRRKMDSAANSALPLDTCTSSYQPY
jgi:hypothetical protein